jgi:hypothetical protein
MISFEISLTMGFTDPDLHPDREGCPIDHWLMLRGQVEGDARQAFVGRTGQGR